MKVAIILFSPTGNTFKVGTMLEHSLHKRNIDVQVINMTRIRAFKEKKIMEYLCDTITDHDLLCIGSPVYAHHLHYNVKEIIKSLPKPGKGWGRLAIPFVSYGGINSGVALYEAAKLLKKSGRSIVAAMKINSSHCLTKLNQISVKINENMPGKEAIPIIDILARKISEFQHLDKKSYTDVSNKLKYQSLKVRLKAFLIFRERFWQRHIYPPLFINHDACVNCGKCVKVCPVQRISINENGLEVSKNSPECIHCGSCVTACHYDAISFNADWEKWNRLLSKAAQGEGPLCSNENPKSCVY